MNILKGIQNYMLKGMTPKGIVQNMAGDNPVFNNLINMAENGDTQGIEQFAKNVCKQRNIDFDKEFAEFKKNFN